MPKNTFLLVAIGLGVFLVVISLYVLTTDSSGAIINPFKKPSTSSSLINSQDVMTDQSLTHTQQVTLSDEPNTFQASEEKGEVYIVPNSKIKVLGPIRINLNMQVNIKQSTLSAGLLFANSSPNANKNIFDSPSVYIYYYPPGKSWVVRVSTDGEKEYYRILTNKNAFEGKYRLYISSDGKEITIANYGAYRKTIKLKKSLYQISNIMASYVIVAPSSIVEISELGYEY